MASKIKVDQLETVDGTGNITVNQPLSGSGAGLTSLPAGNLTGVIPAANLGTGTASASTFLNGSGAYSAAGGGAWTLIESTNVTTAQASITISGIDATYATYAIIGEELIPVTDHVHAYIRFGDASGIDSASTDYSWAAERGLHTDGTTSGVTAPIYEKDYTIGQIQLTVSTGNCGNGDEGSEGEGFSFTGQLRGMRGTLMNPMIAGECHYQNNQHISMSSRFVGIRHHHTMAADRVNFLFSSGDIASGRLTVWGIKHT